MTRLQRFWANLLYWICRLVGYLPWWFLYYVVAEVIAFLLYHVARYRVRVVRENLRNSFPEKTEKERKRIERKFYRHLAEIFIDTIDLTGITHKQLAKRMVLLNEEKFRAEVKNTDWIAALAHYGSWEYFCFYTEESPDRQTLGVYRPLHSIVFDRFYLRMRSRLGIEPVSMNMFVRHVINNRRNGVKMTIGLIADQAPPIFKIDHLVKFLNQPTPFFHGLENTGKRFGMPVFFLHMKKTRRAHYECWLEQIYDGKEEVGEFEITERYAAKLEEMIRQRPELWMWSHRRWKHQPPEEVLKRYNERHQCQP